MGEVSAILRRYNELFGTAGDEATADAAAAEIGRMTSRLRELAGAIAQIPYEPQQEKHTRSFQAELDTLMRARLTDPQIEQVLAEPDLQLKILGAHQAFVTEGLMTIGQAIVARQPGNGASVPNAPVPQNTSRP
jgi:hypothetical protein